MAGPTSGARDAIRLGREHSVPAEIHYKSGSDSWWYAGPLWLRETRPVQEHDFNPLLLDPRNRAIIRRIRLRWTDQQIAWWMVGGARTNDHREGEPMSPGKYQAAIRRALAIVADVRAAFDRAGEPHQAYIYGLQNTSKADERILVSIDQDMIKEAPMVPFTRTEKGTRRVQLVTLLAMIAGDAILLYAMLSLSLSTDATQSGLAQASSEFQTTGVEFGLVIALVFLPLAIYLFMARRTLVLDLEVQPLLEGLGDTHTEAVFLVNSQKTPAAAYVSQVLHLDPDSVRGLTREIVRFQADTIANLQEHNRALRGELDSKRVLDFDAWGQQTDLRSLGRVHAGSATGSSGGLWIILIISVIVTALATWGVVASGI